MYQSAILLITLIANALAEIAQPSMKYVVFNGEICNIPGNFGRACVEYSNNGVLEVIRVGTGDYIVYFNNPFPDNNYVVLTSSNLQETGGAYTTIGGNDHPLNSYYGVSPYFVRIDTRKLGSKQTPANSDYISVVINPQFGMSSVVFDGEDCNAVSAGGACTMMRQGPNIDAVSKLERGLYEISFLNDMPNTGYAVLASSNVWGSGGAITSIGGNTDPAHPREAVLQGSVRIDTRIMNTNSRAPSDYISMIAGTPSPGISYAVFDGNDCTQAGVYGLKCKVFRKRNVNEVIRTEKGKYIIYWLNRFGNNNYAVLCDSNVWGPGGTVCGLGGNNDGTSSAHGVSVKFVEIQTRQMDNNDVSNSDFISVIAF